MQQSHMRKKNQYKHKHLLAVKSVCDKMLLVQTV